MDGNQRSIVRRSVRSTIGKTDIKAWDTEKLLQEILNNSNFENGFSILNELLLRLESEPISPENMCFLVQGISELCTVSSTNSRQNLQKILQTFVDNQKLKSKLQVYIINISDIQKDNALTFLSCLMNIVEHTCEVLPTYSLETVVVLLSLMSKTLENVKEYDSLNEKFQALQDKQNEIIQSFRENRIKIRKIREPPNNFRSIDVLPSVSDILLNAHPFLRKNVIHGAYRDTEHYLDIQFRLLREDFVLPMRNAIAQYKQEFNDGKLLPYLQDARLYKDVHVLGMVCQNDGIARKVKFDVSRFSRVKWEKSRRLMNGSLVCMSHNNFQSLAFGVVSERSSDELQRGVVYVKFDENTLELVGMNPFREYDMIESVAYYESYKHNLLALQEIQEYDMPMKKYILNQNTEKQKGEEPVFLRSDETVQYDMSCLIQKDYETELIEYTSLDNSDHQEDNSDQERASSKKLKCKKMVDVLDIDNWPSADELGMDESQCNAMKQALTKEFSIIQGPPGTGKTYIGLKMLQVLLENREVWSPDSVRPDKILIACYTNHALDQFLNGILDMFPSMVLNDTLVRIGGHTSSDDRLLNCKLSKKVCTSRLDKLKSERIKMGKKIDNISALLSAATCGIVHDTDMELIMGYRNLRALENKYRHLDEELQSTSIVVLWLSMADKRYYRPRIYPQTNIVESKKSKNVVIVDDDENNDDILRIMADEIETSKRKKQTNKIYSHQFREIVLTYDDIEAEKIDNHELDQCIPHFKRIMQNQLLRSEHLSVKEANEVQSHQLWRMSEGQRWKLYRSWVLQYYEMKRKSIKDLCNKYEEIVELYNHERNLDEIDVLKRACVIGITTTGAAKYSKLIAAVKPKIFLIEEAAEILEAHIITTLTNSCEQLILIGDHQQLRPNPASYTLAKDFKLDISLFERMVRNDMHLNRLSVQHRMRPEISKLLVPHIYEKLQDHTSVFKYPSIKGVKGNIYFLNHNENESQDEESRSHSNLHEANFIVAFCRYLIRQGYLADEISILTTYKGQQFLIKELMNKGDVYLTNEKEKDKCSDIENSKELMNKGDVHLTNENEKDKCLHIENSKQQQIRIVTVDNFQGEENKIIVLSLVRSNDKDSIGFLKMSNRICVALSRAKHGFYVIGNMRQLAKNSKTWENILSDERMSPLVVDSIPLACQNHPETEMCVKKMTDFDQVPEGGCALDCEYRLQCGHACILQCHPYDREHDAYKCYKQCVKRCPNGHECKQKCYECTIQCVPCNVQVERKMSLCGHLQTMACYVHEHKHTCEKNCEKSLPCGHNCQNICGIYCTKKCKIDVEITLECGHTINKKCHIDTKSVQCDVLVIKMLDCGHEKELKCYEDPKLIKCNTIIEINTCEDHKVKIQCHVAEEKQSQSCSIMVPVTCPLNSGHKDQRECHKFDALCSKQCNQKLKCEHKCKGKCGDCFVNKVHKKCETECSQPLPCGHKCQGQCYICESSEHHLLCCRPITRYLDCGHHNSSLCNLLPSKCLKPCQLFCQHGQCDKRCGETCDPCKKICKWECPHYKCNRLCFEPCDRRCCNRQCQERLSCGHKCQGYCGEPCLLVCYDCQKVQFIDVAKTIGYRITRPWGFVRLHPCNHSIQGFFMDDYVKKQLENMTENHFIEYLKCPLCHVAVRFCPRYSNDLKMIERRMMRVKALQSIETRKQEYLFKVIDSENLSLLSTLQNPTYQDLLGVGIMCILQACRIGFDGLDKKLENMTKADNNIHGRRKATVDFFCDVTKTELELARQGVKKMMKSCHDRTGLQKTLVLSIETLLRCKVADLDIFIQHQVKRVQIKKMVSKLQDHEDNRIDGTMEGIRILKEVIHILEDNFTVKQRDHIECLMSQMEHCFKPVSLVPAAEGNKYAWVLCSKRKIHYLPRYHRITREISSHVKYNCVACESEDIGTNIFQDTIDRNSLNGDSDTELGEDNDHTDWLKKRQNFLQIFKQPMEPRNTTCDSVTGQVRNTGEQVIKQNQSSRGMRQGRGRGRPRTTQSYGHFVPTINHNPVNPQGVRSADSQPSGPRGNPRRRPNRGNRKKHT